MLFEVPVEARLELGAIVRLDDQDAERKPPDNLVHEADGGGLAAAIVDLEHPDTGAVVDSRELIQALAGACDPLQELHIQLQPMSRLWLLISVPGAARRPTLVVGWQPAHPMVDQDAVYRRAGNGHLVEALQVVGNPAGTEAIAFPQVQDL